MLLVAMQKSLHNDENTVMFILSNNINPYRSLSTVGSNPNHRNERTMMEYLKCLYQLFLNVSE